MKLRWHWRAYVLVLFALIWAVIVLFVDHRFSRLVLSAGIACNAIAVGLNGGRMPVLDRETVKGIHIPLDGCKIRFLCDVIRIGSFIRVSAGDLLIIAGNLIAIGNVWFGGVQ